MRNITVTTATEKDRNQLFDYFKHYKINKLIEQRIMCYTSHNVTLIAKHQGTIVGVLQWYIKEDPMAGVVEIEEVHVAEAYRGKGIGSALVTHAIQSVKKRFKKFDITPRKIFLFVAEENGAARALYEKHGFTLITDIGPLFSDNETALLYWLDLQEK